MPTALEIAQGRSTPLTAGLFRAVQTKAPLFSAFDVRTSPDTKFLTLAIVSLPTSSFANLGEGFTASDGTMELREFTCSLIGGLVKAELITAGLWNKAHAAAGANWFDLQMMLKSDADILNVERQMIDGLSNDAKGFPGAKDLTPFITGNVFTIGQQPQDTGYTKSVLNVAGTTATTASSVYSFVFGELESQLILGNDSGGELVQVGEIIRQHIAPDSNFPNKTLEHDLAQMQGFVGLSVNGFNQQVTGQAIPTQYSVRRAANITADSGKTCTDIVMDKLARSHGTGRRPSLFAMSGRSGEQLAASRAPTAIYNMGSGDAATNQANIYPDPPDNWRGIPIVYPDVIGNTDAIEAV